MIKNYIPVPENPETSKVSESRILDRKYEVIDGDIYFPSGLTTDRLPAGLYTVYETPGRIGLRQEPLPVQRPNVIKHETQEFIMSDFKLFWEKAESFNTFNQLHKRGCLMYGPQGCGKSQLISLLVHEIIAMDGLAVHGTHRATLFMTSHVRYVEPGRPVLIIMEDIDGFFEQRGDYEALQILDGLGSSNHVFYIATTNYIEKLKERITDRPQRFDVVIEMPTPDDVARRSFIEQKLEQYKADDMDIEQLLTATAGMSFAHIQELLISVLIMGYHQTETLDRLTSMKYKKSSNTSHIGFSKK